MKAIYAVRDKLAGIIIGNVLTFAHDAPAARFFRDAVNDEQSPVAKHPHDYELVRLCSINDEGHIMPVGEPLLDGFNKPVVVLSGEAVVAMQAQGPKAVEA